MNKSMAAQNTHCALANAIALKIKICLKRNDYEIAIFAI